jgi:L-ascorbate metabolism protein UlaG (beta-lactamase superfamily)
VTHGGSIDVPVREFLATWPAHDRLHKQFDADVAAIPVPASARAKAATLAAYVRFANTLDVARLKAAHRGEPAWRREVQAESDAANDPAIAKLEAVGFNESCTSR